MDQPPTPDKPNFIRSTLPGVTIVIPNWNHEFVLSRSIKSALLGVAMLRAKQVAAEILVIDDGSRDGSLTLLRQLEALYFEQGLQIAALGQNHGVSNARNLALQLAHYQYVLFMDADNELIPENIYQFYRSIVATRAAVVYGNLIHQGPTSRYLNLISNESFQNHIFSQNYIDTFALYDRLQLADAGAYQNSASMDGHEDWELFLHLAASGRLLVFVPIVFGIYYELPQSRVKHTRQEEFKAQREAYVRRVFDQFGIRQHLEPRTKHLRYHPDIGYI